jgi:hypothetical protein
MRAMASPTCDQLRYGEAVGAACQRHAAPHILQRCKRWQVGRSLFLARVQRLPPAASAPTCSVTGIHKAVCGQRGLQPPVLQPGRRGIRLTIPEGSCSCRHFPYFTFVCITTCMEPCEQQQAEGNLPVTWRSQGTEHSS